MAELLCKRPDYGSGLDGHSVIHCGRQDGTLCTKAERWEGCQNVTSDL